MAKGTPGNQGGSKAKAKIMLPVENSANRGHLRELIHYLDGRNAKAALLFFLLSAFITFVPWGATLMGVVVNHTLGFVVLVISLGLLLISVIIAWTLRRWIAIGLVIAGCALGWYGYAQFSLAREDPRIVVYLSKPGEAQLMVESLGAPDKQIYVRIGFESIVLSSTPDNADRIRVLNTGPGLAPFAPSAEVLVPELAPYERRAVLFKLEANRVIKMDASSERCGQHCKNLFVWDPLTALKIGPEN